MSDNSMILFLTLMAFLVVLVKLLRSYKSDPTGHVLLFYFFFGFGPVINYLLGFPIYFGTVEEQIPKACLIMLVGIVSLALPNFFGEKKIAKVNIERIEPHRWQALKVALVLAIFYGAAKVLIVAPLRFGGASKIQMINAALPGLHYIYLLMQFYLCAFYFSAKTSHMKKLYWGNFMVYLIYCLVIGERDFIFPLFSVLIFQSITKGRKKQGLKLLLAGLGLALGATAIFFFRDSSQESANPLAALLGQGSILFINTYVLKIFEGGAEFFHGETFLNSLLNLAPSWIYKTDYNNLDWFKSQYAAASDSGYGFALDAEGYMNFGLLGVFGLFILIGLYFKFVFKRFESSEFARYMSVFSVGFIMYALRNDSLALFKGHLYGAIIYLALNTTSYLISIRTGRSK